MKTIRINFEATHGKDFQKAVEEARRRHWQGEGELEPAPRVERPSDHPLYCPGQYE
jgi:hypothetical protein